MIPSIENRIQWLKTRTGKYHAFRGVEYNSVCGRVAHGEMRVRLEAVVVRENELCTMCLNMIEKVSNEKKNKP